MSKAKGAGAPASRRASAGSRAITSVPASRMITKVSAPAGSTTSTRQSAVSIRPLPRWPASGDEIASGRMPNTTSRPTWRESEASAGGTARLSSPPFSSLTATVRRPSPLRTDAGIRFIAGEPMKSATNMLAGLL